MSLFEKELCPVCKKAFEEEDDIVVCPECGTPHHRDCYNMTGHCVNKSLHKVGYDYRNENKTEITKNEQIEKSDYDYYIPQNTESTANTESSSNNETADNTEQNTTIPSFGFPFEQGDEQKYNDDEKIDGESLKDIAATIRNNAPRFINIFQKMEGKKKKLNWNWGAFFFGSLYYLFRKMYKQGVAFFCLFVSAIYAFSAAILKFAPESVAMLNSLSSEIASNKTVTAQEILAIQDVADYAVYSKICYILLAVILILRIIEALFADYFYKTTIFGIVKSVKEQLEQGSTFMQVPFMEEQNFSQSQMKQFYLAKKGGFNPFAPLMALLILSFIIR